MKRVGSLPLQKYEFVHATDPDYACDMMGRLFTPYTLDVLGPRTQLDARLHSRRLADTSISFARFGSEVGVEGGPTDTYFIILMPLSGTSDFRCRSSEFLVTPSMASIVSPSDVDLAMQWHEGLALLIFRIEQPTLEAHLAGMLGECLSEPLRFDSAIPADRGKLHVGDRLRALVRDIDQGGSLVDHPVSVRAFEQSLMTDLLIAQPHNYRPALTDDVKAVGSREVRHAVSLMESHPEWPLSLEGVATTLSVSGRSLQRGFRRDLDTSFSGLLHDIRLRRMRDDLRRSSPGAVTVQDVVARWNLPLEGYTSRTYRECYGELPSETLHHLS